MENNSKNKKSYKFDLPAHHKSIIKVIGIGGGGGNAVSHMYNRGIKDVEFVICNTDMQPLNSSAVPDKLQLGVSLTGGLGVGGNPETGREAANESIDEIKEGFKRFSGKISKVSEIFCYYNIARIYFGVGNYSDSLAWLNKILNDREVGIRQDLHCSTRILNLIVHYELGNYDLVEYRVTSTQRFLNKRGHLYKFETAFLNFFQKTLPKIIGQKELIIAFKELKKELEQIFKYPFERRALEYFDFISWLNGKIV